MILGCEDELSLRAACDDSEHLVTRPQRSNQWPGGTNGSRELKPGDVRGDSCGRRVATRHLPKVAAVDPGAAHLDQQLIGNRLIDMALGNKEAVIDDRQRPQVGLPRLCTMVSSLSSAHEAAGVNLPNAHAQRPGGEHREPPDRWSVMLGSPDHRGSPSLNNAIRLQAKRRRNREVEGFCRPEIDRQVKLRGLLDREIAGLRALEDPIDVHRRPLVQLDEIRAVRDEAAGFDVLAYAHHDREPVCRRQLHGPRLKRLYLTEKPQRSIRTPR